MICVIILSIFFVGGVLSITPGELQQCTANLACAVDYKDVYQTMLDNATHVMQLELEILKQQTNSQLLPLQTQVYALESKHSQQTTVTNAALGKLQNDVSYDRQYLANLSQVLYTLNDDIQKQNMIQSQDIHKLVLDLTTARNDIANLQATVKALLGQNATATKIIGSIGSTSCTDKDTEITQLKNNLTYYMNAFTSAEKALENVRTLEAFLQTQVVQLKANLTKTESVNHIKDNLIVSLQNQLQAAKLNVPTVPTPVTCSNALGMKDGKISDSSITASESQPGYGPEHARLDNSQGWYTPERSNTQDFLQIDTGSLHYITKVATQGAPCCDVMVTNYTLQYSADGSDWKEYKKDCAVQYLTGNTDTFSVVEQNLTDPVLARFVRFNIKDFKKNGSSNYVGMRVELYGCKKN